MALSFPIRSEPGWDHPNEIRSMVLIFFSFRTKAWCTDYGHSWSLKEMSEEKMHVYVNISSQNKIGDVLFPALNRRDSFPRFPLGHACKVEHHPLSSSIPSITSQCLFLQGRVSLPPSVQLALSRSVSAPMPLTLVLRPLLPRKVWIISPRP